MEKAQPPLMFYGAEPVLAESERMEEDSDEERLHESDNYNSFDSSEEAFADEGDIILDRYVKIILSYF